MLEKIAIYVDFRHKVGMLDILDYKYLALPVKPDTASGIYDSYRLSELERFCAKNPDYHIVSQISAFIYVNKAVQDAFGYKLAIGDNNPNLICLPKLGWEDYTNLLILELWSSKLSSEEHDGNRSVQF